MAGEIILYTTDDGQARVSLREIDGSVWLTQAQMAGLFQVTPQAITQHVRAIYAEGEWAPSATCKEDLQVRTEGSRRVSRSISFYSLPIILAVGFRVRSPRGGQFRRWAATALSDYLVKGFVIDDARLKEPGWDYFDELLERIRDIRASEKRFYQKIRDLFAQTSADYDRASETAHAFFQTIQNKMLYAVTGQTAAELIVARADASAPNMNLTAWKGGRVRKGDVAISKNYLSQAEVSELNRLTTMFLDFAEDRASRRRPTMMTEWVDQTDRFLVFNEREVLTHKGRVSHETMEKIVEQRYLAFDESRRAAERAATEREEIDDTLTAIEQVGKNLAQRGEKK